ncbi:MAG: phosphate/phosphite/phosphonate ABC transporter substrate-binding protein [Pseudomonadota bacterium]|nr:MAG: phosphate/phosphite/phosphonate ABC transporter substrate-binding protein [Pseudomonadota bacterium]
MSIAASLARCLLALALLLGACSLHAQSDVLVLGRVSNNPAAHYDRLKPLLDYVVTRMGDLGIREGRVLMAPDTAAMASYLRQGQVDWVTETAGAAMDLIDLGSAQPLALSWRGGEQRYYSVFLARRDSGIGSLDELKGHAIAFQHPNSTSAYLVPAGVLLERGLSFAGLLSPLDPAPTDRVGYAFTGDEANSVAWVHQRLVDVASISNQDFSDLIEPVPDYRADLHIIGRSPDYPRALELARQDLPEPIRRRLLEVLLNAGKDPQARPVLDSFFRTDRFTPYTPEIERQLEMLRPMVRRVRRELQ